MAITKRENNQINYSNRTKTNSDFSGKDLRRSNCFNSNFSNSNFNHVSFRGAQFKACNFTDCTFDSSEFVASNLKNARFKNVKFENTIFDSANLEGADFEGAEFKNVIFVSTDLSSAKNLNLMNADAKVFDTMPVLEINKSLERSIKIAMKNEFVKFARVLDTKDGKINPISASILLNNFDEETLHAGLRLVKEKFDKNFCTLSYIIDSIKTYKSEGLI